MSVTQQLKELENKAKRFRDSLNQSIAASSAIMSPSKNSKKTPQKLVDGEEWRNSLVESLTEGEEKKSSKSRHHHHCHCHKTEKKTHKSSKPKTEQIIAVYNDKVKTLSKSPKKSPKMMKIVIPLDQLESSDDQAYSVRSHDTDSLCDVSLSEPKSEGDSLCDFTESEKSEKQKSEAEADSVFDYTASEHGSSVSESD